MCYVRKGSLRIVKAPDAVHNFEFCLSAIEALGNFASRLLPAVSPS